jgi:hypothetical protein
MQEPEQNAQLSWDEWVKRGKEEWEAKSPQEQAEILALVDEVLQEVILEERLERTFSNHIE